MRVVFVYAANFIPSTLQFFMNRNVIDTSSCLFRRHRITLGNQLRVEKRRLRRAPSNAKCRSFGTSNAECSDNRFRYENRFRTLVFWLAPVGRECGIRQFSRINDVDSTCLLKQLVLHLHVRFYSNPTDSLSLSFLPHRQL